MDMASLKKMTVVKLREEAKKIPDATGVSGMKKDELIALLASHHGIEADPEGKMPPAAGRKPAGPLSKTDIKKLIKELKERKRAALAGDDSATAHSCNRQIHHYKRVLRRMARQSV